MSKLYTILNYWSLYFSHSAAVKVKTVGAQISSDQLFVYNFACFQFCDVKWEPNKNLCSQSKRRKTNQWTSQNCTFKLVHAAYMNCGKMCVSQSHLVLGWHPIGWDIDASFWANHVAYSNAKSIFKEWTMSSVHPSNSGCMRTVGRARR